MKGIITTIVLGIVAIIFLALTSCSSEKRLQRKIERHGIKESITFVINKYPEYFKSKDTTILDTIVITDTLVIDSDTIDVVLSDSNNILTYTNDSISITIDKATNKAKIIYKEKIIPITKVIYKKTKCPQIICPDCDDLVDNTVKCKNTVWYYWVIMVLQLLFIVYLLKQKNNGTT